MVLVFCLATWSLVAGASGAKTSKAPAGSCTTRRVLLTRVVTVGDVRRREAVRARRHVVRLVDGKRHIVTATVPIYRTVETCPVTTTSPVTTTTGATSTAALASPGTTPTSTSTTTTTDATASSAPGWTLENTYTFSGNSLNTTQWYPPYNDTSAGSTGGYWLASHAVVANGMLTLSEYKDPAAGGQWTGTGVKLVHDIPVDSMVEVRMRIDAGAGIGAVALLLGASDWPPEIDFYEDDPTTAARNWNRATIHYGPSDTLEWNDENGVDATGWHTWGVEWTTSSITYTVDGNVWASIPNPDPSASQPTGLAQPQNLCLQIGTTATGPNASTPSVVNMQIQWVAVYSATG